MPASGTYIHTYVRTYVHVHNAIRVLVCTHTHTHTGSTGLFASTPHKLWGMQADEGQWPRNYICSTSCSCDKLHKKSHHREGGRQPSPAAGSREVPPSAHWPIQQLAGREEE